MPPPVAPLRRRRVALAVAAAALVAAAPALARATPPAKQRAEDVLLRQRDLPRTWSSTPAAPHAPPLACPGFHPVLSPAVLRGAAVSPTFQAAQGGPFLSQAAYVYATAAQETIVWARLARPGLLRCLAASVTGNSTTTVRFTIDRRQTRTLPVRGVRATGYRVSATASAPGGSITTFVDLLVLGHGRVLSEISVASFGVPATRSFELRLEGIVARRLDALSA